ncbi:DNA primase [Anaerovirgula multivorans]|uniref:DNA primase n=1 Tax=Anaerovirgula multivorans TaxID=312168 RepID=A0A239CMC4_9FIRM|nr:toprim domain-containing protein [Anaerovirgula multivorans]SNS21270.1 DNA primase [Anaerovirgula multivorans]
MRGILHIEGIDIQQIIQMFQSDYSNSNNPNAFGKAKPSGEDIMCCCPFHSESKPSFGVSTKEPYSYNCFTCGESGTVDDLARYVYGDSGLDMLGFLKRTTIEKSLKDRLVDVKSILSKESIQYVSDEEVLKLMKKRHAYIEGRGFTNRSLLTYEVGYDSVNSAITFPVRDLTGGCRFIVTRSINSKHFHIPNNAVKKDVLYGLYYLKNRGFREVFINEAPIDTISCYQSGLPAVAVLGKFLFKEQVRLLIRLGFNEVNLFYDNDKWGVDCTHKSYELLKDTPIKVNVVKYPKGNFKDANDLLRAGRMKDIEKVSYVKYLLSMKNLKGEHENGKNFR